MPIKNQCMYGSKHEGDAWVVRNKVGKTIGYLCAKHKKETWDATTHTGFHLHTFEEMGARGDHESKEEAATDARDSSYITTADIDDTGYVTDEPDPFDHRPGAEASPNNRPNPTRGTPYYLEPDSAVDRANPASVDSPAGSLTPGHLRGSTASDNGGARDNGSQEGQHVGNDRPEHSRLDNPPTVYTQATPPTSPATTGRGQGDGGYAVAKARFAAPIEWWQGAGELVLEDHQRDTLWMPFPDDLFECRYDGTWYLPWIHVWQRLLIAFAPSVPQLLPIGEPRIDGLTVSVHYCLLVNGCFIGEAVGSMSKDPKNTKIDYADCVEGCVSDAITRIGKRLGVNAALWNPDTIRNLIKRYPEKLPRKRA